MRYFMGIDPDMHTLPIAVVDETGNLAHLQIVEVSKKLTGRDALVSMCGALQHLVWNASSPCVNTVEGQELYQFGASKTKNPKSIMFLATVAGMALSRFGMFKYFPTPQEWKGSIPKQIHQARVLARMELVYDKIGSKEDGYCVPKNRLELAPSLRQSDWKHAVDAIGLAQWGREKFLDEEKRVARLAANPLPH